MKHDFFKDCRTAEEVKAEYRKLCKLHHPDNGGDEETMKEVNAQFTAAFNRLKNTHRKQDGTTWTAEAGSKAESHETPEEFIDIINRLMKHNLTIEIIGSFVWVSGDTKPVKDDLKSMNFKWHSKKLMWYLAPAWYSKKSKKDYSMEEIRDMFGSRGTFQGREEENNEYQPAPVF